MARLDPGFGHQERRCWARTLGALEEIDVYLARHPKLTLIEPVLNKPVIHGTAESEPIHT